MRKDPFPSMWNTPTDEVVQIIEKYDLVAVPVVDSIGRLVGQITVDDVMDEVREQSERLPVGIRFVTGCGDGRQRHAPDFRTPAVVAYRYAGRYRQLHDIG